MQVRESKENPHGTDMILGSWVCVQDLPSDSSCTVSELRYKTKAFGPDLCPKYHKEQGGGWGWGIGVGEHPS